MTDFFSKLMKERLENGPKYEVIVPKKEPPFNYDAHEYSKENIPKFIRRMLDDPYIPDREKHIFYKDFVVEYIEDSEYADSLYGSFLVFVNNKYYDVVPEFQDVFDIGRQKDTKYAIQIKADDDPYEYRRDENGDLIKFEPAKTLSNNSNSLVIAQKKRKNKVIKAVKNKINKSDSDSEDETTDSSGEENCTEEYDPIDKLFLPKKVRIDTIQLKHNKEYYYDDFELDLTYKTICSISHYPKLYKNKMMFPDEITINDEKEYKQCLLDIGCERSNIFTQYLWDFPNKKFRKDLKMGRKWNMRIGAVYSTETTSAGENITEVVTVFLKYPLYISVGGLEPVPIHSFNVPIEPNDELYLIGNDILNKHTYMVSKFSEGIGMKIIKQRTEL